MIRVLAAASLVAVLLGGCSAQVNPTAPATSSAGLAATVTAAGVDPSRAGYMYAEGTVSGISEDGGDCIFTFLAASGAATRLSGYGKAEGDHTTCGPVNEALGFLVGVTYTAELKYVAKSGASVTSAKASMVLPMPSELNPTPLAPPTFAGPACDRNNVGTTYKATDNSAGHAHGILTWSNRTGVACSMNGYPQVWLDNPEARGKLGSPASHGPTVAPSLVVLGAGGLLHAAVTITEASFIDGCNLTKTTAMLVSPPLDHEADVDNELQNVTIPLTDACFNYNIGVVTVGPVTE